MLVYFDYLCCGLLENVFGLFRKNNIVMNVSLVKYIQKVYIVVFFICVRWIEKDYLKEFKCEIEFIQMLKFEKQVLEFLVLQIGFKIND